MGLKLYHKKRDFEKTREPRGKEKQTKKHRFVVQEHHASHLHFDFRLEMEGVMKSWAVPKGPSLDPSVKRLAMMVEDHPIDYMYFEGKIPLGEYGGGEVRTWDIGTYEAVGDTPMPEQVRQGKLTFILHGKKLNGEFHMVHTAGRQENAWLLFKVKDEYADPEWELVRILPYGSKKEAPDPDELKKLEAQQRKLVKKQMTSAKPATRKRATTRRTVTKKTTVKATKPKTKATSRKRTTAKKTTAKRTTRAKK
jgi:bifunctional non-homologous end joining protein LigD